jgi:hypothetical protein
VSTHEQDCSRLRNENQTQLRDINELRTAKTQVRLYDSIVADHRSYISRLLVVGGDSNNSATSDRTAADGDPACDGN